MNPDHGQIVDEIQALARHYPRTNRSVDDELRWARDYAEDLAAFNGAEVAQACRRWRQSESSSKCPTPGQLLAVCRQVRSSAQHAARPPEEARPYEPWTLSSADVADMSLTEALRYHLAMAAHCRQKAGPMWKAGRPAGPDELSERWHSLTRAANDHEAEAARLRARLVGA